MIYDQEKKLLHIVWPSNPLADLYKTKKYWQKYMYNNIYTKIH